MKIPAVWMASAFAAGIALAGHYHLPLRIWIAAAAVAIAAGAILALRHHTIPGATFALLAWFALGGTALSIERAAVPVNHISRLLAGGQLDTTNPCDGAVGCVRIPSPSLGERAMKLTLRKWKPPAPRSQ